MLKRVGILNSLVYFVDIKDDGTEAKSCNAFHSHNRHDRSVAEVAYRVRRKGTTISLLLYLTV